MTAARISPGAILGRHDGLQPTNIARDLYQIARLVELSFAEQLDDSGRAAVREMKALGSLGPLLLPLAVLDWLGAGISMGYVWRARGRVVGNVNIYPGGLHPDLGRGWLVANVAVHPDYRRRGIARQLMDAALAEIRRRHVQWVSLQVEVDNNAARNLYLSMGFEEFETLAQWQMSGLRVMPELKTAEAYGIRPRARKDYAREADLIFRRARRGGMAWTRTLSSNDLRTLAALHQISGALEGRVEYWVQPELTQPDRLIAAAWLEHAGWRRTRITLFTDPHLELADYRLAMLRTLLSRPVMAQRIIRLETTAGDPAQDALLHEAGFYLTRQLVQMRLILR